MKTDKLNDLRIDPTMKTRPAKSYLGIFLLVLVLTGAAIYYAIPRKDDNRRLFNQGDDAAAKPAKNVPGTTQAKAATAPPPQASTSPSPSAAPGETILTVSGYVIPRERIELSPRFMGTVKWIGVKKGDAVTNNQVVVLLDDAEYRARQRETQGRLASAIAALQKAELHTKESKRWRPRASSPSKWKMTCA